MTTRYTYEQMLEAFNCIHFENDDEKEKTALLIVETVNSEDLGTFRVMKDAEALARIQSV